MDVTTINNYWKSKQKLEEEVWNDLSFAIRSRLNELPFDMLSDKALEDLTYYTKDLSFDISTYHKFRSVLKILRHYPLDQKQLSTWNIIIDQLYNFINYHEIPEHLVVDFTDTFIAERLLVGVKLTVIYAYEKTVSAEIICDKLNFTQRELELFVNSIRFGTSPDEHTTQPYFFDSLVEQYKEKHFTFDVDQFNFFDEGYLFVPIFICYLRSIARRRSPEILRRLLNNDNSAFYKKGRVSKYTYGLHLSTKKGALIRDDLLYRSYDVEEFKTIYGISN